MAKDMDDHAGETRVYVPLGYLRAFRLYLIRAGVGLPHESVVPSEEEGVLGIRRSRDDALDVSNTRLVKVALQLAVWEHARAERLERELDALDPLDET